MPFKLIVIIIFCINWVSFAGEFPKTKEISKKEIVEYQKNIQSESSLDDQNYQKLLPYFKKSALNDRDKTELEKTLKFCIEKNLNKSLPLAYLLMGKYYLDQQQPSVALQFIDLAQQNKSSSFPIPINYFYSLTYSKLGNYNLSQEYLNSVKTQNNPYLPDIKIKYVQAYNFYALQKYEEAIELYEAILMYEKAQNNTVEILDCYAKLALANIAIGNVEKGLELYNLSLNKGINLSDERAKNKLIENKKEVSEVLRKQNLYKEELEVLSNSASIYSNKNAEFIKLAASYYFNKKINQTIVFLNKIDKNQNIEIYDVNEIKFIAELADQLEKQGKIKKALQLQKMYIFLNQTITNNLKQFNTNNTQLALQNLMELEILKKDKDITNTTIQNLLLNQELKDNSMQTQQYIIGTLTVLFVSVGGFLLYILRISKQRKIANQKLALRSLRTQMNPHFIYNALNSVNSFISQNDEKSANLFLSNFSKLMRLVMENSEFEFISLAKEIEILKLYIELEHFRFNNKFKYSFFVDENMDEEYYKVPPMMLQPFVENAVWHGLRYLENPGELNIRIQLLQNTIEILISDNGIGRAKSAEFKTKNQKQNSSLALKNITQRIKIIEDLYQYKIHLNLSDCNTIAPLGTLVCIRFPIILKNE